MEENNTINDSLDNSEDLADMDQGPEEQEEEQEEQIPIQSPHGEAPEEDELTWEQRKQLKQAEKAQYQLQKAQKREEYQKLREQKALLRQKKADEREENRKEREQIKLERERMKMERDNLKRKRAEEREEAKQERLANTFNRRCKGSCGKSRSNQPPKLDKRSCWFVCYGCKAYNLCIKCGANNPQDYALFQEHSQQCDPYYQERIAQQAPPQPVPPPTLPPPAPVQSPITATIQVTPYTPIITMEDYDLEHSDSGDDQLNYSLPSQAQNLLNFYVPPKTQESTYKGCWTGDSLIYKSDGSLIEAKNIKPGDLLIDYKSGQPTQVAAVLVTTIPAQDPPVKLVQLSQHCTLTSGHPVLDLSRDLYVRADSLGKCNGGHHQRVEKLFNFELKDRACEGILCDGGIIAATVGTSFQEIKKVSLENDQAWGDGYWTSTRELLRNNYFPNIKYLTSSS